VSLGHQDILVQAGGLLRTFDSLIILVLSGKPHCCNIKTCTYATLHRC